MNFGNEQGSNNPDKNVDFPTAEEINQLKKDMHMTDRAMRVNETPEDYKREREESWAAMNLEEESTDREVKVEQVEQEGQDTENLDSYEDLPNVKFCKESLKTLLEFDSNNGDFSNKAKDYIYKMLTQRSEFVENTHAAGKNVAELMADYQEEREWYRNTRELLESSIDSREGLTWDSNPGWFGINTRPEVGKREGNNMKVYATIPVSEYAFIQHVPELANELRQLAVESDDKISVKIPESLSGFMSHNDSLVVHFKDEKNADKIQEIMNRWMQEHDVHESSREMGRTKLAADSSEGSFSELVAKNIAGWLEENAGKYDSDLLSSEAVKHAIKQSQTTPF